MLTLTKKAINRLEETMFRPISTAQKETIFQRFGTEPEPHEWTEEDISIQIRNFLDCGEFVKPTPFCADVSDDGLFDGKPF
jgi:hypothetical protein